MIHGLEINNLYIYEYDEMIKNIKYKKLRYISELENLEKFNKNFDRIIMPLAKESHTFLEYAIPLIKNNGIIHYINSLKKKK
ncbi:class I SAM-dependent methyltransferase family protein [Candidatus Nanopusillus massiliensis]|uniref:hypothetical protein n=1 Tax=Candidatus Nanopusillus massiliensis TaxID=2897163 RepID=UPI001E638A6C|nr:hypothetical protein [Candidatus Nanopusillus massiliensis]